MRAVVYAGPGEVRVDDVPEPEIEEPTDAIVAVKRTAVCGSDLHLVSGKIPGARPGVPIGHEFVGVVRTLGEGVGKVWEDMRVLGSFLISCGKCPACSAARFNLCAERKLLGLGEVNGDLPGAQADLVRIPHADLNLRPLTGALAGLRDDEALFAGDILATGFYAAHLADLVSEHVVVVVGAGPVGLLCAQAAARVAGRVLVLDNDDSRVGFAAENLGLEALHTGDDAAAVVAGATSGAMAHVVIDAVGAVPALKDCLRCVRPGGRVVVVGVYVGERYDLALGRAWNSSIDLRFAGTTNVQAHWDEALIVVAKGEVEPTKLITHTLPLEEAVEGYRAFGTREAMKVVLTT